jgi:carbonic anhydrase
MIIVACVDARVNPTKIFGLELGDAVVMRNNGGRVTPAILDEITALAMLVSRVTGQGEPVFHIALVQHTKCGAQQFADPAFQAAIMDRTGIDVSAAAITDPQNDLLVDIDRLRDAPNLHDGLTVSAMLYDIESGQVSEIMGPQALGDLRAQRAAEQMAAFQPDPVLYPFRSHWADLEGGSRVHYVDEGEGPVLLLLHGNPSWSFLYRDIILRLSGQFRCIAPDLPGFGLSEAVESFCFTAREHARTIVEFIHHLDLSSFSVSLWSSLDNKDLDIKNKFHQYQWLSLGGDAVRQMRTSLC